MSHNTNTSGVFALPATLIAWSTALGLLLLAFIGADYYARLRVLHEGTATRDIVLNALLLLIAFGLLSSCALLRRLQFATHLLQASLVASILLFVVLLGWLIVAFVASELGPGGGLWRFFVPAISVLAVLTAWPFILWRRLRQLPPPVPSAPTT